MENAASAKGLPRYDDPNTTIEHIMPKTLSDAWHADLGPDAALHEDYVNKLGNLALTSNNPEMSNSAFEDKKDWYKQASFAYTRELSGTEHWDVKRIRKRSERLAERCLKIWSLPAEHQPEDDVEDASGRRPNFRFSMVGLEPGDEVAFSEDASKTATVVDDMHVLYQGKQWSLSRLAQALLGVDHAVQDPLYFCHGGETLVDLRDEAEGNLF